MNTRDKEKIKRFGIRHGRWRALLDEILDETPITMEYETDAREVWPKRWWELEKRILEAVQNEHRCTCERCSGIPCESLYEDDK